MSLQPRRSMAQPSPSAGTRQQVQMVWRAPPANPQPHHLDHQHPQPSAQTLMPDAARHLTTRIKACSHWQELLVLCERSGRQFNHINLAAAVTHLAKMHTSSSASMGATTAPGSSGGATQRHQGSGGAASSRSTASSHLFATTPASDLGPSTSYSTTRASPSSGAQPQPRPRALPSGASALMDRLLLASGHNPSGFETRQLANMLWAVAKCGHRPPAGWLQSVVSAAGGKWGHFEAQHVANMAWALAVLGHDPGRAWMESMLQESLRVLEDFKPQELSNLAYATAILLDRARLPARRKWLTAIAARSSRLMDSFSGQELTCLAWAMSRMAHHAGQRELLGGAGAGVGVGAAAGPGAATGVPKALGGVQGAHEAVSRPQQGLWLALPSANGSNANNASSASNNGSNNSGQSLSAGRAGGTTPQAPQHSGHIVKSTVSGAEAGLGVVPGAAREAAPGAAGPGTAGATWMQRVITSSLQRLAVGDLTLQGVTLLLLASARLWYRPPDGQLLNLCLHAQGLVLEPGRRGQGAQGGGRAHWAWVQGQDASRQWVGTARGDAAPNPAAAAEAAGAGSIGHESVEPEALANLLVAMAQLRYQPPAACIAACEAAAVACMRATLVRRRRRRAPTPAGDALGAPSSATAARGPAAASTLTSAPSPALGPPPSASASSSPLLPGHMGDMLWSMSSLGWTPSRLFLQQVLLCTACMAPSFSGPQVVQVLAALARLRVRVGRSFVELCCAQLHGRLGSLNPRMAVALLGALVWHRHRPSDAWMLELARALQPQLSGMRASDLAVLLYRFASLGHRPGSAWFAAWSDAASRCAPDMGPTNAAVLLWSAATLELPLAQGILRKLAEKVADGEKLSRRCRARAAWALACLLPPPPTEGQPLVATRRLSEPGDSAAGQRQAQGHVGGAGRKLEGPATSSDAGMNGARAHSRSRGALGSEGAALPGKGGEGGDMGEGTTYADARRGVSVLAARGADDVGLLLLWDVTQRATACLL